MGKNLSVIPLSNVEDHGGTLKKHKMKKNYE